VKRHAVSMKNELARILEKEEAALEPFSRKELITGVYQLSKYIMANSKFWAPKKVTPRMFHRGRTHKY
jgi:hypothetical protein